VLELIAAAVQDRSARGVAAAVGRLVHGGHLAAGTRLPTVRSVAATLRMSPTTVSEAWSSLARAGAIQTRGRSGTFVLPVTRARDSLRYARVAANPTALPRDLSTGVPDPELLPSLAGALASLGDIQLTTSYLDEPVLPPLETALRARWPYPPEQVTVVDGALDALDRVAATIVRYGDRVLVENPTFPPMLDLLDTYGAAIIGVPVDAHGLVPSELSCALDGVPVALFLQPRAQNPTGVSMTATRAEQLAEVLSWHGNGAGVTVVEDDHAGEIATAEPVSLGARLPDQVVHIRSFSKSHGPDLRLAAIGGPATVLTPLTDRRLLGPGWSSRLLQAVLCRMLTDLGTQAQVAAARHEYARRRTVLRDALAGHGITAGAADGINVWLPVADQQKAMLTLAAHGIAVAPGAPFEVSPLPTDHVRITLGAARDDLSELAALLAEAAGAAAGAGGRRRYPLPRTGR
jgi:DNA-binding transcriptional MocR family regulator